MIYIDKDHLYYYVIFLIWFTADLLSNTTIFRNTDISINSINGTIDILTLFLLLFVILLLQRYTIHNLELIISLTIPVVISAIFSGNYKILSLLIFVVAAQGIDMMRLIRDVYHVLTAVVPTVIIMGYIGLIEDVTMFRSGMIRHSYGFAHPNTLGVGVFQIVFCYVVIHEGQFIRQLLVTFLGMMFVYFVPNSQSPALLLAILAILLIVRHFIYLRGGTGESFRWVLMGGALLSNLICVFATMVDFSKYPFLKAFNLFISTRFSATRRAYLESGIKLLGQVVFTEEADRRMVGLQGHLYLDTAYATLLIRYGLIVYIIVSVAYLLVMNMQRKKRNDLILILLFVFSVYGITESSMFMLKYNFLFLYASELLYCYNRDEYSDIIGGDTYLGKNG